MRVAEVSLNLEKDKWMGLARKILLINREGREQRITKF